MTFAVAHAVVTGSEHVRQGIGCQDAAGIVRRSESRQGGADPATEILYVAISDGAGSARHPEVGAKTAVATALAYLQSTDTPDGSGLVAAVQAALIAEAAVVQAPVRELSCTLLVAKVGPETAFFAQIGDGAIVLADDLADTSTYRLVFQPHKGEHTNETRFVSTPDAADHIQVMTLATPRALALLTDGLERQALDLSGPTAAPFAPFFATFFGAMDELVHTSQPSNDTLAQAEAALSDELHAFLGSARVAEATGDDVTFVLCAARAH